MNTSLRVRRPGARHGLACLVLSLFLGSLLIGAGAALAMGRTPPAGAAESSRPEAAQTAGTQTTPAQASAARTAAPEAGPAPESAPEATRAAVAGQTQNTRTPQSQSGQDDAIVIRNDAPGYNGYAGTWRDPETGDIVTSVIAPRRQQEQTQQPPIYIAPQIEPDWPGNGYGNQSGPNGWNGGWNGAWNGGVNGWQQGGNNGWQNGGQPGAQPGWTPGPHPGGNASWGQGWRPQRPGLSQSGQAPPAPAMGAPGQVPAPPSAAQPGMRPPQNADRPGPGGLPLPDMGEGTRPGMQPGMRPPQAGAQPTLPVTPSAQPPATNWQPAPQPPNWQGTPPDWRPSNWQPRYWQPQNWQPGAWQPWGQQWAPSASSGVIKAWTPGEPPHGDWQPLSWSPGPAGAWHRHNWQGSPYGQAWNPWRPAPPVRMAPGMRPGMGYPGPRARFLGQPQLPPNITRHLGPVVPLSQRGGLR